MTERRNQAADPPTWYFIDLRDNPELMGQIDEHRREFELLHGPTDPSTRYTTQLPRSAQRLMRPEDVYRGAPPFVQSFAQLQWKLAADDGRLDDVADGAIKFLAAQARRRRLGR